MDRRRFVQSTLAAGAGLAAGSSLATGAALAAPPGDRRGTGQRRFKLNYAPNFGTFAQHVGNRDDFVAHLEFMASEGFTALEFNGLRGRSVEEQELIGRTLERLNMRMGVFVAHDIDWSTPGFPNLPSANAERTEQFLAQVRGSVDVARRVNATWMTVVPGNVDARLDMGYQTANVITALRQAAEFLEPHGLVMVLEPLNTRTNHPGQFLTGTAQSYAICKAVNSPSCKILYDIYHQQITEGNIIPNMNRAWDEIAYIQVGDNPGRNEPGTGEINYRNIFRHLHERGYTGVVGMEHGASIRGSREGERAVINAYVAADDF